MRNFNESCTCNTFPALWMQFSLHFKCKLSASHCPKNLQLCKLRSKNWGSCRYKVITRQKSKKKVIFGLFCRSIPWERPEVNFRGLFRLLSVSLSGLFIRYSKEWLTQREIGRIVKIEREADKRNARNCGYWVSKNVETQNGLFW